MSLERSIIPVKKMRPKPPADHVTTGGIDGREAGKLASGGTGDRSE